jgi:hypothetical protein
MRHLLFLSVLLLAASWAMAQNENQTSPSQTSPSTTQTSPSDNGQSTTSPSNAGQTNPNDMGSGQTGSNHEMSPTSSGDTSVQGCLSGSDGNYTLTDKNGNSYRLTGDTAKLSEHIGHEVKITGSTASSNAAAGNGSGTDTMGGSPGSKSLQVSSVKHVSKTCPSGGGGMSH